MLRKPVDTAGAAGLQVKAHRPAVTLWGRLAAGFEGGLLARLWGIALILWLASLIATPISIWVYGPGVFPPVASLGVVVHALTTLAALACGWDLRRIITAALIVGSGAWAVEALGTATGFPFGLYEYTPALQPQLLAVPLLIPLAWLMMLIPAWAVAEALLIGLRERLGSWYRLSYAAVSAVAMTAWDLYLDPQMVSKGLWVWENPGGFFGIPWVNYLGWLLTAFLLTMVVRPEGLPRPRLLIIYALTWLFQAVGLGVFWGQPGPALAGFVAMGALTFAAFNRELRR